MKKYLITVKKDGKIILQVEDRHNTKKNVLIKYSQKYMRIDGYSVSAKRLKREAGKQVDLLDMINECEKQ